MTPVPTLRREISRQAQLAAPVVLSQLASMMLWVIDLLMIGRVGVAELAAVSLARSWLMGTMLLGMGVLFGIDPIAAQAHGARDAKALSRALQSGLVLALVASLPVLVCWLATGAVLRATGQDPALAALAQSYALVQLPGIPFFLVFIALRQWLQARGIMRPAMWIAFLANGVNAFGNWLLIYGNLGFPALGVRGAGISTAVTEVFMAASLAWIIQRYRLLRGGWRGFEPGFWWPRQLLPILGHGVPVAAHIGLEYWAFAISTLMAGRLGAPELAAHTIVISLASLTFMVPLGIAIAAVTRVGNLIGAGRPAAARQAAAVALGLGAGVMGVSAIGFIVGREWLGRLFTADAAVVALCAAILPIAAAFQIFDGIQAVGGGILRGMGQTRPAAVFNFVAYYLLALPLAWWFAFGLGGGLVGLWWALALGLAVVAVLLLVWLAYRGPQAPPGSA